VTDLLLDSKVMGIARALGRGSIPYAFGGTIELAYYAAPRGTEDIDVNVFLRAEEAGPCLEELERLGIARPAVDREMPDRQAVLSLEHTPIHVFFSYDPFHESCKARRQVPSRATRSGFSAQRTSRSSSHLRPSQGSREVREVLLCMGSASMGSTRSGG
jgi:hypothetical protein